MYKSKSNVAGGRKGKEAEAEGWSRSACIWRVQLQHERQPPSSDLWACCEGCGPVARLVCKPPMAFTDSSTKGNPYRAPRRLNGPNSWVHVGS